MRRNTQRNEDRVGVNEDRLQGNEDRERVNEDRLQGNEDRVRVNEDQARVNEDRWQGNEDRARVNEDRQQRNEDGAMVDEDRRQRNEERVHKNRDQLQGNEERPRVHSYAAPPRSPTLTADTVRQKKRLSQSLSSTSSHKLQMHKAEKQMTSSPERKCYPRNQYPDDMTENNSKTGSEIILLIKNCDDRNKELHVPFRRSCTVEEYLKWNYILHSPNQLDQLNVYLKNELGIQVAVMSDSVVYFGPQIQIEGVFMQTCDRLVKFALNVLGKGLRVIETDLQSDQTEMCIRSLGIYTEALQGHVYCVCMERDLKKVTERIGKLVQSYPENEKIIQKDINVCTIWNKVAELIKLDHVLKEHCKCSDLDVALQTFGDELLLSLIGPETAVNLAELEFKSLNQHLQHEKCDINVTLRYALLELQVESFLDEHLLTKSIRCVTQQKKDKILVYGFSVDCVSRAKKEVETIIIEKTCIVQGQLKQSKDFLVSQLIGNRKGKIVIHIADSGFLHVVGVRPYVHETCQRLENLKNKEEQSVIAKTYTKVTDDAVGGMNAENVLPVTQIDKAPERREATEKRVHKPTFDTEEETAVSSKEETHLVYNRSSGGSNIKDQKEECADMSQITDEESETQQSVVIGTKEKGKWTIEESLIGQNDSVGIARHLIQEASGKGHRGAVGKSTVEYRAIRQTGRDIATNQIETEIYIRKPAVGADEQSVEQDITLKQTEVKVFRQNAKDIDEKLHHKSWRKGPQPKENMITERIKLFDPKVKQFMVKSEARTFLKRCADENHAIINTRIYHGSRTEFFKVKEHLRMSPEAEIMRKVTWQMTESKKMILAINGEIEDSISATARYVSVLFKQRKKNKDPISTLKQMEKGVVVVVRVPDWINGKGQDQEQLADSLSKFIDDAEEANVEHVILPLDTVHNWPDVDFIPCVISRTVKDILLCRQSRKLNTITLSLKNEMLFDRTFQYICKYINKLSAAEKAKRHGLQVLVVSGELDKIKADVIVNTTSRDLDLSNGRVSTTLLKAAGSNLQKECRSTYPNGISHLGVAVTGGHKLSCEKVFHIALDRYHPQNEMNSIETIRCLTNSCLKTASELNLKTIAFPAIGTGILRYPIDLVASAMFESVERFKYEHADTSLTEVLFVIYPANVTVMEVFKKNEEFLAMQPGEKTKKVTEIQIEITGMLENVLKTKSDIIDKCEDEVADSSEMFEEVFSGVTRQAYIALSDFHKKDIKAFQANGGNIMHELGELRLWGRLKNLKRASRKIREYLKNISKFHFASLSVQCHDHKFVEAEIHQENFDKDVICILDKYHDIVYIYAHSPQKVSEVRDSLNDKLNQSHMNKQPDLHKQQEDALHGAPKRTGTIASPFRQNRKNFPERYMSIDESMLSDDVKRENTQNLSRFSSIREHEDETNSSSIEDKTKTKASKECLKSQFCWEKHARNIRIFQANDIKVRVYEADILFVPVDCIVNPANQDLNHCGGLALTIAKAAGDSLVRESAKIIASTGRPLPVTSVVKTTAGLLNYKCILHAVGPCWYDYKPITEESSKKCQNDLKLTVIHCFMKAEKLGLKTVALPAVSSGLFGVPKELCAIQYANAILEFNSSSGQRLEEVHFVDTNHDMIDIIHSIFTPMIEHNKKVIVDAMSCLKDNKQPGDKHCINYTNMKTTGRDKPYSRKANSEEVEKSKEKLQRTVSHNVSHNSNLMCNFSPSHSVLISDGDILNLQGIHALVCSEDRSGQATCEISKLLLEMSGNEYETAKAEHFTRKRNFGDVITTTGFKSSFLHIMHAITPKKDLKALHMIYSNLFDEVVKKEIHSMAMPLLGTGTGHFEKNESAVIFLAEWIDFLDKHGGHPLAINLVLNEKRTGDLVKDIFKQYLEDEARFHESFENQLLPEKTGEHQDEAIVATPEQAEEDCVICMEKICDPKKLKCGHRFCTDCIEGYFRVKQICPICGQVCGIITGDQPDGKMEIMKILPSCAGYEGLKSIAVSYYFPSGTQGKNHPRPGTHYRSISRTGYLPDNKEGREVCAMLKVAFERRLVFTIGTSRTTGEEGVITWNDIHHKTDMRPNTQFGYPDQSYLQRVREEMEIKGVTTADTDKNFIKDLEEKTYRKTFTTSTTL